MKKLLILTTILTITLIVLVTAVKPNLVPATNTKGNVLVIIPENAVQLAPNVFSFGQTIDREGRIVEGRAIIHYKNKEPKAKPGTECGNGICEPGENANKCSADCGSGSGETDASSCYGFLAKDAKWKIIEPYIIDTTNNAGLSSLEIKNTISTGIQTWEDAANKNILGEEVSGNINRSEIGSLNNKNEVIFADVADSNAIAVTIIWGIFYGPPFNRELVEWDQIYDDTDFQWSSDCTIENCSSKMDLPNIVIHELGHSFGLNDLYTVECSEQTMYGYAENGETKKRTLEAGDINGINKLYF